MNDDYKQGHADGFRDAITMAIKNRNEDLDAAVKEGASEARAEIVAKLRERADHSRLTSNVRVILDLAAHDHETADWIEAGCPS